MRLLLLYCLNELAHSWLLLSAMLLILYLPGGWMAALAAIISLIITPFVSFQLELMQRLVSYPTRLIYSRLIGLGLVMLLMSGLVALQPQFAAGRLMLAYLFGAVYLLALLVRLMIEDDVPPASNHQSPLRRHLLHRRALVGRWIGFFRNRIAPIVLPASINRINDDCHQRHRDIRH